MARNLLFLFAAILFCVVNSRFSSAEEKQPAEKSAVKMTAQELATAALERLPIVTVIVNNGWLGMVRQWQELFYSERYSQTHLTHQVPDYAQLAEAYGCAGFTAETEGELEAALAGAFGAGRSAVVDVRCDPEEKCFPMVPAGAAAVDVIEAPDEEVTV